MSGKRPLVRAFCREECCRDESSTFLSTTLEILTESLKTNPQGWKTILQLTKALKSPNPDKVKTAVYALTELWSRNRRAENRAKWDAEDDDGGKWDAEDDDRGKWREEDGRKWNPGFSSMEGLPDDVYQAHLEALRDMLQFKQWREYTYEANNNDEGEEQENDPVVQEAYIIASIRDDFEQIIPQHLLPLLREIQSLASSIMSNAVNEISENNDIVSWVLMKEVCERNWELVKPYLPQLCRATCDKLLRGSNIFDHRIFWVTLCNTVKNVPCCQEAMTEIACTASQLSKYGGEDDNTAIILTAAIKCGIWTHGSFARLIETSFSSLAYPWTPALTRFLHVLLTSYDPHKASADTPTILSLLKQTMDGVTDSSPPESCETIFRLCARYFPSILFCTTTKVSWFLSSSRRRASDVLLALNYSREKSNEGDNSVSDIESLVLEAVSKKNWSSYERVTVLSDLLYSPDKLTIDNAVGMLTILSQDQICRESDTVLNSTIRLLVQCVSQVGLLPSILQTTLGVARKRMGRKWKSSSLVTLELDDENAHQAKRVCRRFKQSSNFTFTPTPNPIPASASNTKATTRESLSESLEELCCQLMSVALMFSQTLFQLNRDILTETPAAIVIEYLDLVCD